MVLKFKIVYYVLGFFDDMENCFRVEKYVKIIVFWDILVFRSMRILRNGEDCWGERRL